MLPFVSKTIPEPRPSGVSIWTTDGDTSWKTLTKLFCSAMAAGSEACDLGVERLVAKPTSMATPADTTRMTRESLIRFMPPLLPSMHRGNLRTARERLQGRRRNKRFLRRLPGAAGALERDGDHRTGGERVREPD